MAKVVLVTGASMGFGPATSTYLAQRGFRVYGGVSDSEEAEQLRSVAAQKEAEVTPLPMSLSDSGSIDRAVDSILERENDIYALVNNASLLLRGFFEDLDEDEIRDLFEVNFFATLSATRAVLPVMRRAKQGRIVVISSVAGRVGTSTGSIYSATRFAQEGFAESLYQEVLPLGIRVALIEPGITNTPTWTVERSAGRRTHDSNSPYLKWYLESERRFGKRLEQSRIQPIDIAKTVHRAIVQKRPRLRYVVGAKAGIVLSLRRYLPSETFNRIFLRAVSSRLGSENLSE